MNAPAIVIRLELEAAPRVTLDVVSESEEVRLEEWLDRHPEQVELVSRALELGEAA